MSRKNKHWEKKYLRCKATGKIRFESEATASRRARQYSDIQRHYHCRHCGGWHLTSWTEKEHQDAMHLQGLEETTMQKLRNKLAPLYSLPHFVQTLSESQVLRDAAAKCDLKGIQHLLAKLDSELNGTISE